ncbi:MAG: HEAT repeat domain-containing protein, partial [Chloroflexota bacterium]
MNWLTGKGAESKKWIAQLNDPAKRAQAVNELMRLGPAAVDGLLEALVGKDDNLRGMAGQILVKLGPAAIPRLGEVLASAHPETRQRAADILGETRHPSAVPPLIEAARGQFFTVRERAAAALAKIGDPQAVPVLIELLGDREPSVRIAAALAVGKFRDPRCLIRLSDVLLEDHDIEVRQAAAQGLAYTRLKQAIPYLVEAMGDSFWWYERENAAKPLLEALASFGREAVEPLCEALRNPEGAVRRNAAILLGQIADPRAIEPLGMALYDVHFEVGEAAGRSLARFGAASLEILDEATRAVESGIRLHALSALSQIKDARVLPLIANLLHDRDRQVQKQAIQSLADT